ncbi:MAG: carbohydrate deacetylase [Betaproteobacteria bacterium]
MASHRLIVNADDLGRTRGINAGILEAHRDGIVTSATLMVNYPAAAGVKALAAAAPGLGIGLHVQLSGGPPQLPPLKLPSLVGKDGLFAPKPDGLAEADPAEVLAEVRAQLARFRELLGRDPTHFDGHHHAHRVPAVFAAVVAVARETGRPVRLADPPMEALLRREGIATTDRFDESFFDEAATLEVLLDRLRSLPEGTTELMCHPAVVDEELRKTSSYATPRDRERQALTSPAAREAVRAQGIELISFADL